MSDSIMNELNEHEERMNKIVDTDIDSTEHTLVLNDSEEEIIFEEETDESDEEYVEPASGSNPEEDVNDNTFEQPIALRKPKRSCTNEKISTFDPQFSGKTQVIHKNNF